MKQKIKSIIRFDQQMMRPSAHPFPKKGWINMLRSLLNMSMKQMGKKIGISPQAVHALEKRELEGNITMKNLKKIANILDMDVYYMFIPRISLEAFIDKKSKEVAQKIVMKTHQTMVLENQEVDSKGLNFQIKEVAEDIKKDMNRLLWE